MYQLKLDHPNVTATAGNFYSQSLNPPADFPISIDSNGNVVSAYSSPSWDLSVYADHVAKIYFGDAPTSPALRLDKGNAALQKRIAFYLLYGERPLRAIRTVIGEFRFLNPVFRLCSENKILISSLSRYPAVVRQLAKVLKPERIHRVSILLQELFDAREEIGFEILDYRACEALSREAPQYENNQHAYIPERIWIYQARRCLEMLNEYRAHQSDMESLYLRCLKAYVDAYGSIEKLTAIRKGSGCHYLNPFACASDNPRTIIQFHQTADRSGVSEVIAKWMLPAEVRADTSMISIRTFSTYLSAVQFAGTLYLATFSGMRRSEVMSLRSNCFDSDSDDTYGTTYLLRGDTTKVVKDYRALWVTVPSASIAVDAMTSISKLRMRAAVLDKRVPVTRDFVQNPRLVTRSYEPWHTSRSIESPLTNLKDENIGSWSKRYPQLFCHSEMTVTHDDFRIARMLTPTLNIDKFKVGKIWPLCFHQFRRTLMVNAASTDYVSLESAQIQLKHATAAMSKYYGRNHSRLKVNKSMQKDFVDAIVESLAMKAAQLVGAQFVSPLGSKHKENIVKFIAKKDFKVLLKLAREGKLSIRETALGVCMMRGACPFGGWDYVVKCDKCDKALYDQSKRPQLEKLNNDIVIKLKDLNPTDIPLVDALTSQQKAVQRALDVVRAN